MKATLEFRGRSYDLIGLVAGIALAITGATLLPSGTRHTLSVFNGPSPWHPAVLDTALARAAFVNRYVQVHAVASTPIGRQVLTKGGYRSTSRFDLLIFDDALLLTWADDEIPDTTLVRVGTLKPIPETFNAELLEPVKAAYPLLRGRFVPLMLDTTGGDLLAALGKLVGGSLLCFLGARVFLAARLRSPGAISSRTAA